MVETSCTYIPRRHQKASGKIEDEECLAYRMVKFQDVWGRVEKDLTRIARAQSGLVRERLRDFLDSVAGGDFDFPIAAPTPTAVLFESGFDQNFLDACIQELLTGEPGWKSGFIPISLPPEQWSSVQAVLAKIVNEYQANHRAAVQSSKTLNARNGAKYDKASPKAKASMKASSSPGGSKAKGSDSKSSAKRPTSPAFAAGSTVSLKEFCAGLSGGGRRSARRALICVPGVEHVPMHVLEGVIQCLADQGPELNPCLVLSTGMMSTALLHTLPVGLTSRLCVKTLYGASPITCMNAVLDQLLGLHHLGIDPVGGQIGSAAACAFGKGGASNNRGLLVPNGNGNADGGDNGGLDEQGALGKQGDESDFDPGANQLLENPTLMGDLINDTFEEADDSKQEDTDVLPPANGHHAHGAMSSSKASRGAASKSKAAGGEETVKRKSKKVEGGKENRETESKSINSANAQEQEDSAKFPALVFGHEWLMLITSQFLCHDFSFDTFLQAVKLALMHHFRDSAETALYCGSEADLKKLRADMKSMPALYEEIQDIRGLERCSNRKAIVQFCEQEFGSIARYQNNLKVVHQVLVKIFSVLPAQPWGDKAQDIFIHLLKGPRIFGEESYQVVLRCVKVLSRSAILDLVRSFGEFLDKLDHEDKTEILAKITQFLDNFANVEIHQKRLDEARAKDVEAKEADLKDTFKKTGKSVGGSAKKETIFTLKERLRNMALTKKEQDYFEQEKERFVNFLDSELLRKFVQDPGAVSPLLPTVFTCNPIGELRSLLASHLRESVETWLEMQAEAGGGGGPAPGDRDETPSGGFGGASSYPLATAFQITEEHGRVIPLATMYASFLAAAHPDSAEYDDERGLTFDPGNGRGQSGRAAPAVKRRKVSSAAVAHGGTEASVTPIRGAAAKSSEARGGLKGVAASGKKAVAATGGAKKAGKAAQAAKKAQNESATQAVFLRVINELEWMGFVKPVGKAGDSLVKVDH